MVKLNKIYTRTGDDGTSGLVDGSRTSKAGLRMAAIGDVDEANSAIGAAIAHLSTGPTFDALRRIQNELFDLGADIATPEKVDFEALRIEPGQVTRLEDEMDGMNAQLDALDSFILPGGKPAVAMLYLARAVVRRAERSLVALKAEAWINDHALAYLNRLSDLLFVTARALAVADGGDIKWVPGATR